MVTPPRLPPPSLPRTPIAAGPLTVLRSAETAVAQQARETKPAPLADPTFTGLPASAVALATSSTELTRLLDGASKAARGSAANLTALVTKLTGPTLRVTFDPALVDPSKVSFQSSLHRDASFSNASPSILAGIGPATSALLLDELGVKSVRDLVTTSPDALRGLLAPTRGAAPISEAQLAKLESLRGQLIAYEDRAPTVELPTLSKVRARLEATQKTLGTMAGLLEKNPVELSDSLVRLSATFQWLEAARDGLRELPASELTRRVKGSPSAARAELAKIETLLDDVLRRKDTFFDARTTSPAESTHRKSVEDTAHALLTQPLDAANPFEVKLLPNLSPKERIVETEFTTAFKLKGHRMVHEFLKNVRSGMYGPPNVIAPDDAKMLSPRFARADVFAAAPGGVTQLEQLDPESKRKVQQSRAETNIPLHMTATVIARLALVQALDDLAKDPSIPADQKTLLVTCGGVAAGKGYAVKNASDDIAGLVKSASLVYDTDGETSGTFNEFVMKACQERGIHPLFVYVHADANVAWERVFSRAAKEGRMVSEEPFLDSHVDSPRNFAAFHEAHKDDKTRTGAPAATFVIIDNASGSPQLVSAMPEQALKQDRDRLRHDIKQKTNAIAEVPEFVVKCAKRGEKLWPERYGGA